MGHSCPLFLYFRLFTLQKVQLNFIKNCWRLDSNPGALISQDADRRTAVTGWLLRWSVLGQNWTVVDAVKWSMYSLSILTTRVQIQLKSTILFYKRNLLRSIPWKWPFRYNLNISKWIIKKISKFCFKLYSQSVQIIETVDWVGNCHIKANPSGLKYIQRARDKK